MALYEVGSLATQWKALCMKVHSFEVDAAVPHGSVCIEILLLPMLSILIFRWKIHDVQADFQLCFLRSFNSHKSSLNISYLIGHTQLEITETKTKKTKMTIIIGKDLRLAKK